MTIACGILAALAGLLGWLYVRAVKKNAELVKQNEALQAQADVKDRQNKIAADRSLDPDAIIRRLRSEGL